MLAAAAAVLPAVPADVWVGLSHAVSRVVQQPCKHMCWQHQSDVQETILEAPVKLPVVCWMLQVPGDRHIGSSDDVSDILEAGVADMRNTALHAATIQSLCT
mgnify:CR=1 FL=1